MLPDVRRHLIDAIVFTSVDHDLHGADSLRAQGPRTTRGAFHEPTHPRPLPGVEQASVRVLPVNGAFSNRVRLSFVRRLATAPSSSRWPLVRHPSHAWLPLR